MTTSLLDPEAKFGQPKRGKVRDVYDLGDKVLIVATDRISAFDVIMANVIPDKGRVLNQMSAFWFSELQQICPNHVVATDDEAVFGYLGERYDDWAGRMTLGKKTKPLAIECVARAYISGSLLKEYRNIGPGIHGQNLPDGLVEGSKLPETIFTPATKAESGHDENISFQEACDIVGVDLATQARDWTLRLFSSASDRAAQAGLILADTKFEFGVDTSGLIWIDEALTPDSSRYWDAREYEPGKAQPSYDKQFVRDYLERIGWNKLPPGPELPEEVVQRTRNKYLEVFRRITGREL